jgi:hypothetical protein
LLVVAHEKGVLMPPNDMSPVSEFLNPKAMLTPGVAGGTAMMIANTIWVQFGVQPRWSGLILSFVLGGLVAVAGTLSIPAWQRLAYAILNSLVIFSVCMGTGYAGYLASEARGASRPAMGTTLGLASTAYAQGPDASPTPTPRPFFPLP